MTLMKKIIGPICNDLNYVNPSLLLSTTTIIENYTLHF
jgi:hypothetical protein